MEFNPATPTVMHVDINSCFATIEQQANPSLRGRPIAVVAYSSPSGCILTASVEAKRMGVKTGMRLADGKKLCPALKALLPDAKKYRFIHHRLHEILGRYCQNVTPKSIDEFVLNFKRHAILERLGMVSIAERIKRDIRRSLGEHMSVSVGISVNRQLAKVAAGMKKPDGLVVIDGSNFMEKYKELKLVDLCGINVRNEARLNSVGIYTVAALFYSPLWKLKSAFKSINAYYWYLRIHGWECDEIEFSRRSFGNSYSIPQNYTAIHDLSPILAKLVNKSAARLRKHGYSAHGIHMGLSLKGGGYIHHGLRLPSPVFYTAEIFKEALRILKTFKIDRPVHTLSVSCFDLYPADKYQLALFEDVGKKKALAEAQDKINNRFGAFVLITANMAGTGSAVQDRIAFGEAGYEL